MARKRPDYPPEYRQQLVELVRAGRSADALAKEFDPSPQTIRNWVARADRDDGESGDGLASHERDGVVATWAGTKERAPQGPNKRMEAKEQTKSPQPGYPDP